MFSFKTKESKDNQELYPYKYETHMHTSQASACAVNTGAEMAAAYAEAGYQGIIITDHFFNGNTCIPSRYSWEKRLELFYQGFLEAKAEGEKRGLQVFFGWEYGYHHTDLLTYGLSLDFLRQNPDILNWSVEQYADAVHQSGGFITHAHPFREAFYISKIRLLPELTDGVEVVNASHRNPDYNQRAKEYAKKENLIPMSGSDAHATSPLLGGGMAFSRKLTSIEDFIATVRSRKDYILLGS